jgi:hypothetical protein
MGDGLRMTSRSSTATGSGLFRYQLRVGERQALQEAIRRRGTGPIARQFGLRLDSLARLAAGIETRSRTVELARAGLASLASPVVPTAAVAAP